MRLSLGDPNEGMSHGQRNRERLWDTLLAVATIWSAIEIPWQLEFGVSQRVAVKVIQCFLSVLFAADLCLRWRHLWTGHRVASTNSRTENHPQSLRWLLADVPAAIPFALIPGPIGLVALRMTKLARLVQTLKLWRQRDIHNAGLLRLIFFVFWMLIISYWIACGWAALRDRLPEDNDRMHYLRALYWTITTLATVGYGDITPANATQMLYAIMAMLFGVGLYGYGIANVAHMLANIDQAQTHYHSSLDRLSNFLRYRKIPMELQQQIFEYYSFLWERNLGYDEAVILSELPESLRVEIAVAMKREFIEKVPFFQGASPQLVREIAIELRPVLFRPGDDIFRKGEIGRHIYFISKGAVEVIAGDDKTVVATLTDGSFFGEMALLLQRPRSATVRAVEFCDLYALDKATFENIILCFPDFAAHIKGEAERRGAQ
ncbi:MAG: cyclic nucleotide-binding domain-containing protein [Planctomycetia bacterium]|nr:cyclic nucleotide-binding domain-containing protein [Planctomycetia bacterium]